MTRSTLHWPVVLLVCQFATALPAQQVFGPPGAEAPRAQGPGKADPPPKPLPATVKGRVLDYSGKPLAGVAIGFGADRTLVTGAVLKEPKARTDAEGRFQFVIEPPEEKWRDANLHFASKGLAGALHSAIPKYDRDKKEYATEKDFGDVIMIPGTKLFGRVRDAEGKPLPGARIVVRDVFDGSRGFRGRTHSVYCTATADGSGIFDLPCALSQGARLEVTLEGHYSRALSPVSSGSPLEVTMQPSGFVAGRVLDADGKGIEGATVSAMYEVRGPNESTRSGPGGTFRFTLSQPARYRVNVNHTQGDVNLTGRSAVLSGAQGNLEIPLKLPEGRNPGEVTEFTVQAIDKKSREKVAEFTAAAAFDANLNQNANFLDYRMRMQMRSGTKAKEGTAVLNGPAKSGSTGVVRVQAKGYAMATQKDVEWKELQPEETRPPVVIELVPESTLSGKVVDEGTGEPVAGAKIWVRLQQDRSQGYYNEGDQAPPEAVTSAADGSYAVPGMAEGSYEVFVRHDQRPKVPVVNVDVGNEEQKGAFDLKLPAGAVVQLTLTGAEIGQGWKALLQELPEFSGNTGGRSYYVGGNVELPNTVDVPADGKVRWQGLKLCDYRLVLSVPSPPRCGGQVFVPIEPFRVRRGGVEREVDISRDRPGRVRGTITFPGAGVPFDRVVVTAKQVADDQNQFFNPYQNDWSGPRAFVDRNGAFELVLGPGRYSVELVDIQTGLRLHGTQQPVVLASGASAECNLAPMLISLRIKLEAEQEGKVAMADRLEVRCIPKDQKQNRAMFGGNDNHDFGNGFDLEPGQREVQLVVPPADVSLFLRNSVVNIRIDDQRYNQPPLAKLDFEAADGPTREQVLKLPPPPEIPADDEKPKAGVDADGVKR